MSVYDPTRTSARAFKETPRPAHWARGGPASPLAHGPLGKKTQGLGSIKRVFPETQEPYASRGDAVS